MTLPSTLEQKIAERVGKELIELIPPEQWQELVKGQINRFMTVEAPKVAQKLLEDKFKEDMHAYLAQNIWGTPVYSDLLYRTGNELVLKVTEQAAPMLFAAMLEPAITGLMRDLQHRIRGY